MTVLPDRKGLVRHAVCKATGKLLPHKAQLQYLSRLGRHVPLARAQRGDTIYWAINGNCRSGIRHVGIVKDSRTFLHVPGRGGAVREQRIWTQSGNLKICRYAVKLAAPSVATIEYFYLPLIVFSSNAVPTPILRHFPIPL
jgi:hypothetical protein